MSHKLVQVKDVCNQRFQVIDGRLTVLEALNIAKEHNVDALIIQKRNEHDEFGLVLLSDIAKKVIGKNKAPERVNVYEIMSKPLISVDPNMDVRYCARLFENFGLSKVPVIEGENIIGMVGYEDIVLKGIYEPEAG